MSDEIYSAKCPKCGSNMKLVGLNLLGDSKFDYEYECKKCRYRGARAVTIIRKKEVKEK